MGTKIVEFAPEQFIGIKKKGSYWQMPSTWESFNKQIKTHGYSRPRSKFLAVFFDGVNDEIKEDEKQWAVAMSVEEDDHDIVEEQELQVFKTIGGLYAVSVHFGSYEAIGEVWNERRSEIVSESRWKFDVSRPSFEWYQNDSVIVPPELLLTLLCDPVIKR